jgi:hypothetical protein
VQRFYIVKCFKIKEEENHGVFQFVDDAIDYINSNKQDRDAVFYHIEKHELSKPKTKEIVYSTLAINETF